MDNLLAIVIVPFLIVVGLMSFCLIFISTGLHRRLMAIGLFFFPFVGFYSAGTSNHEALIPIVFFVWTVGVIYLCLWSDGCEGMRKES